MIGRITRVLSNDYTVRYDDGNEDICKARGVFRNKKISPLVGDIVEVDNNKKIITDIHKRKNELIRPPVANIDIALIVTSAKEPTFSSNLLDKMIDIIEYNNITPVICISKYDLLDDTKEIDEIINYYKSIGYSVFINTEIDKIREIFKDKVSILTGQTGVGKSSLINSLLKAYSDVQDNLITTSEFPGTTLDLIEIPLDENSSIYDSPGIVNRHQIAHLIDENTLKDILPQSELRPVNYQLNCKQTLYFGGLARLDFLNGSKTSMTCYFHRRLQIHRTKLENADALYNRHKTLKPEVEELKDIQSFKTYQFRLPENKVDVVISGLGFVTIHCPNALIEVKAPEQVGVFIREALI
mgnify:CR=1 FL=1